MGNEITSLEEAKDLRKRISEARGHLIKIGGYAEDEVEFRRGTIYHMLTIAFSDVMGMIKEWEPEEEPLGKVKCPLCPFFFHPEQLPKHFASYHPVEDES